jgi:hypothetical protein
MPAVDIKRFTKESAVLLDLFGQPAGFIHSIHQIYEQYANRTIRKKPSPLVTVLPTYQVPLAILRHIDLILTQKVLAHPADALRLVLALWEDGTFESRTLAAMMIGKTNVELSTLQATLTHFVKTSSDEELVNILLTQGLRKIRADHPDKFLTLMFNWCATRDDTMTINAFNAIIYHINDDNNINLPEIIDIVMLPVRTMPQSFQFILIDLIKGLFDHSDVETIYFIKQLFMEPMHEMMPVIFRRILPSLPEEVKGFVKDLLREKAPLHKKLI